MHVHSGAYTHYHKVMLKYRELQDISQHRYHCSRCRSVHDDDMLQKLRIPVGRVAWARVFPSGHQASQLATATASQKLHHCCAMELG